MPQLIALNHLLAHSEVDTATLAVLSQKPEDEMLSILDGRGGWVIWNGVGAEGALIGC